MPNYNINDYGTLDFNLEQMFQDIDWDVDYDKIVEGGWDFDNKRWEQIKNYCIQLDQITAGRKFVWAAWMRDKGFHPTYLHLFLMGQDDCRFNYRSDKVCMWERRMYAGDGMGKQSVKFEFDDGLVFNKSTIYGKCDRYWCSQIGGRPAQGYRYVLMTERITATLKGSGFPKVK